MMEELNIEYQKWKSIIHNRLNDFSQVPRSDYPYELAFCILTPQSSALVSDAAIERLKKNNFFDSEIDPSSLVYPIRFYKNKSRYLCELRNKIIMVYAMLDAIQDPVQLREWLVKNVKGVGLKEASHFLRNIGKRELAILDRHILKELVKYRVIRSIPRSLTRKKYLSIEKKFQKFSYDVKIPMDELDLLFWASNTGQVFK